MNAGYYIGEWVAKQIKAKGSKGAIKVVATYIGKTLAEIKDNVDTFIEYAKQHPELRFHIRKVGYDKAGYTIEKIAPLFNGAKSITNILLPKEMIEILK